MSDKEYQLYAWTENGKVRFSPLALCEQEALLWDEYDSSYWSQSLSWEEYEHLVHVAWQWGMLLLDEKRYWEAYGRFSDGIDICRYAVWKLPVPKDGGVHPFLLALEELYRGCELAVLEEGDTLEELFYESAVQDIRQGLWAAALDEPSSP